uniref:hypothetical protein n=1 Tax=Bradyrhizobium sp. (strain ORS 278) TaxID=114615 RepID=UPI0005A2072D|nr:hypothetical protein [Bradyrhizobium sp. ORS 278]
MHDPVDQPSDHASSRRPGRRVEPETAAAVTIAPDIPADEPTATEPADGNGLASDDRENARPDGTTRLVTPTMWR